MATIPPLWNTKESGIPTHVISESKIQDTSQNICESQKYGGFIQIYPV